MAKKLSPTEALSQYKATKKQMIERIREDSKILSELVIYLKRAEEQAEELVERTIPAYKKLIPEFTQRLESMRATFKARFGDHEQQAKEEKILKLQKQMAKLRRELENEKLVACKKQKK